MKLRSLLACVALVVLAGCSSEDLNRGLVPECRVGEVVTAMAQSVPTADYVPCVQSIPLGWSFRNVEVEKGLSRFFMESELAGGFTGFVPYVALEVRFSKSCDISDSTEIASDEPDTRRFEQVSDIESYSGRRHYVFEGGCATYVFDFEERKRAALATEITDALSFIARADIATVIEDRAGLEL